MQGTMGRYLDRLRQRKAAKSAPEAPKPDSKPRTGAKSTKKRPIRAGEAPEAKPLVVPDQPKIGKRPWDPSMLRQVQEMSKIGLTEREMARILDVHPGVLWRLEVQQAIHGWKEAADARVERATFERAVGYNIEVEKIVNVKGEIARILTWEHIPADVTAQIWWEKNRMPASWRDRKEVDYRDTGELGRASDAELDAIIQRARDLLPRGGGDRGTGSPSKSTH
jgi:hypothetical protein